MLAIPDQVSETELASPADVRCRFLSVEDDIESLSLFQLMIAVIGLPPSAILSLLSYVILSADGELGWAGPFAFLGIVVVAPIFLACVGGILISLGAYMLRPSGRVLATVGSLISVVGFPIGTLISCVWMHKLFVSEKSAYLYSRGYHDVRKATPELGKQYRAIRFCIFAIAIPCVLITSYLAADFVLTL